MFAVVRTGGKQYRVREATRLTVERLTGAPGEVVRLDDVLMIGGDGGTFIDPGALAPAAVFARVVEQKRGDKIIVFKKRRRKNSRRTRGHRQALTVLSVVGISADGAAPEPTKTAAAALPSPTETPAAAPTTGDAAAGETPAAPSAAATDQE
jgi:large subunit ribosomal protein L21